MTALTQQHQRAELVSLAHCALGLPNLSVQADLAELSPIRDRVALAEAWGVLLRAVRSGDEVATTRALDVLCGTVRPEPGQQVRVTRLGSCASCGSRDLAYVELAPLSPETHVLLRCDNVGGHFMREALLIMRPWAEVAR